MFLLGLTGDIACGKSTVARLMRERGAAHLDSDALVHELYADASFARELQTHLCNVVSDAATEDRVLDIFRDGAVNRKTLGELVFADATMLKQLESLVHPAVARLRDEKLAQLKASKDAPSVVVLEAVKLVESGQARDCDALWWITASPATQRQRLMQNRDLSEEAARERLANQPSRAQKIALLEECEVDWQFLSNDASLDELRERVQLAWLELPLDR